MAHRSYPDRRLQDHAAGAWHAGCGGLGGGEGVIRSAVMGVFESYMGGVGLLLKRVDVGTVERCVARLGMSDLFTPESMCFKTISRLY